MILKYWVQSYFENNLMLPELSVVYYYRLQISTPINCKWNN